MNLLIVDDQSAVVNSLKGKLDYKKIGIDTVYTATSAKEARLILSGFPINLLLTDIEMPEEDGLSLFRWTMEKYPGIVGVFLTSHADFAYAREALKLGGFDYILQPARNEEVEETLGRAVKACKKKQKARKLERAGEYVNSQRDVILELLLVNEREGNTQEAESLFEKLCFLYRTEFDACVFWRAKARLTYPESRRNAWDTELVKLVLRNVLQELLEPARTDVLIAKESLESYRIIVAADESGLDEEKWKEGLTAFTGFFNSHMEFKVTLFPERYASRSSLGVSSSRFSETAPGIFWTGEEDGDMGADDAKERVRKAEAYIRENLYRSVSRSEVAGFLHINEDYFTRIFKRHTGYTFKDYDSMVRMETAKRLLEQTRLPVSIIATKVGFDNFSHFSRAFKKYTGKTPTEYR
ncbi:MAG: helix-turn-helix domain-containing protein [Parasporobacterium sp.]|nr:helix-turn-helix domain-containing protein [Parasporobacterium sp.]